MKLRFENTLDDLVAFSRHFHESSPLVKQQARSMAITMFILGWLTIFFINPGHWFDVPGWLFWLALAFTLAVTSSLAVAIYFLWKPYMLFNIGRAVRKLYKAKPDKVAFGPRELELTPAHLIERNDYGEFHWKIAAIEQITSTQRYVFVCISPMRAYILPRECFHEDELEAFLDELEGAHAKPPPLVTSSEPSDAIQFKPNR